MIACKTCLTAILTLLVFNLCIKNASAQKIRWPGHKKAVIILTYDDALDSQLKTAIPQLDAAHLTATFFLTGDINKENIPKWRAVAAKGYELGNHTLYHPCLTDIDKQLIPLEQYTPAAIVREIGVMNNFLFAVDKRTLRTYAYPCTDTLAGGVSYVNSLKRSGLIKYARLGGDTDDAVITDFKNLDPFEVPSYGLEDGSTGKQLIKFVDMVRAKGGMGIFMFHGIGGDYITTPAKAHQQLVTYLAGHRDEIWVTTFQNAMDYITAKVKYRKLHHAQKN